MEKAEPTYLARHIEAVTDGYVNSGVLRSWVGEGMLPFAGEGRGRGAARRYPLKAVYAAAMMATLRRLGVPLERSRDWVALFLDRVVTQPGASPLIAFGPADAAPVFLGLEATGEPLYRLVERFGGLVTVLDLLSIVQDVNRRLAGIGPAGA